MSATPNIERSAFRDGAHVGYGGGAVWTITRGTGEWVAIPRQSDAPASVKHLRLRAKTLPLLSKALESVDAPAKANPARPRASKRETAKNPAPAPIRRGLGYAVMAKNGIAASMVACFAQLRDAKQFAQAIADASGMSFAIEPGAFTWASDK